MATNYVQIGGVIRRTPRIETSHVRSALEINMGSKYPQTANLVANGAAAEELMEFASGDRVIVRGHLSCAMHTGKLRIVVENIHEDKFEGAHHMTIPETVSL